MAATGRDGTLNADEPIRGETMAARMPVIDLAARRRRAGRPVAAADRAWLRWQVLRYALDLADRPAPERRQRWGALVEECQATIDRAEAIVGLVRARVGAGGLTPVR